MDNQYGFVFKCHIKTKKISIFYALSGSLDKIESVSKAPADTNLRKLQTTKK